MTNQGLQRENGLDLFMYRT